MFVETRNPGPLVSLRAVLDLVPVPPPPQGEGNPPSVTPGWRARALEMDVEATGHASAVLALDALVSAAYATIRAHPRDPETLLRDPPTVLLALVEGAPPAVVRRWHGGAEVLRQPPPLADPPLPHLTTLTILAFEAA